MCSALNCLFFLSFFSIKAQSNIDAEDGIKFMQEMIELAKRRNDESGLGTLSWLTTAAAIVILYYY